MNCIAIDDEPLALNVIQDFCSKITFLNLEGIFTNAIDAIQIINHKKIDLIFVDIQMPHITGLEFIKSLKNPPIIILTTAYTQHALEGYELNVVDYLVKPIPFERFFQAVNKAYELYCLKNKPEQVVLETNQTTIRPEYMLVRVEYSTVKVNFSDILYIEGIKDYVKIRLNGKQLLTKCTMKNMEEKLPSENFIRVHKSYIISISAIEKIENNRIVYGDKRIPIGNSYKAEFSRTLDKYKL
jgi:DNA-binding LytR/AlgR family response regulator